MMAHWLTSLPPLLLVGFLAWIYAYRRDNVNVVDSLWSLFFLLATLTYAVGADQLRVTGWLLLCLVGIWSLRLSAHLAIRNAGKPEDHGYAVTRVRNPFRSIQQRRRVFGSARIGSRGY